MQRLGQKGVAMASGIEKLIRYVEQLPAGLQAEVLRYAEYLWRKTQGENGAAEADDEWAAISLAAALRD
jgi:hypothetical protein